VRFAIMASTEKLNKMLFDFSYEVRRVVYINIKPDRKTGLVFLSGCKKYINRVNAEMLQAIPKKEY
jgi:hypothetical protein